MSHFAEIDAEGRVLRVIVAEQDFINSGAVGNPRRWIQTSYNTSGGQHRLGGIPLRKNYAGVGYTYDRERDAFIPPRPYRSWILDESTCLWIAPVPRPDDGKLYSWDENIEEWVLLDDQPVPEQDVPT
jgi:hypothetical protein